MKLHLDIDCTSLDDLKSARATIERLIADHEDREKQQARIGKMLLNNGQVLLEILSGPKVTIPQGMKVERVRRTRSEVLAARNKPLGACCNKYADMTGCDCLETAIDDRLLDMYQWQCKMCRRVWDTRVDDVCSCGYRSDGKYMRNEPCGDEWKCCCGTINAGKAAKCMKCGE
jgi:hypothetical protein